MASVLVSYHLRNFKKKAECIGCNLPHLFAGFGGAMLCLFKGGITNLSSDEVGDEIFVF